MATLELYRDDAGLTEPPILEGQMSNSGIGPEVSGIGSGPGIDSFNTLDEPIRETIWRDVKAVGLKFKHVLIPVQKKSLLKVGFRLLFYGFLLCVVCTFWQMYTKLGCKGAPRTVFHITSTLVWSYAVSWVPLGKGMLELKTS